MSSQEQKTPPAEARSNPSTDATEEKFESTDSARALHAQTWGPKLVRTLADAEKEHILQAMILCSGNVNVAAKALGICIKTLYRRLEEYNREV